MRLVDLAEKEFSREEANKNCWCEHEVEEQCVGGDQAEGYAERDLDEVDEKEKPGGGSDEFVFRQPGGEEVNRHGRSGGICEHCGDARKESEGPGDGVVSCGYILQLA